MQITRWLPPNTKFCLVLFIAMPLLALLATMAMKQGRKALLIVAFVLALVIFFYSPSSTVLPASCNLFVTSSPPNAHLPIQRVHAKPANLNRKLRLLFLSHGYNYETQMDRNVYMNFNQMQLHPHMEVVLWGIGFEGWDGLKTIRENLEDRYGSIYPGFIILDSYLTIERYFDVVYLYGMAHNHQLAEISGETMVMVRENECHGTRCDPYFLNNNCSIGMMTYAQELSMYTHLAEKMLMVHIPFTTDSRVFYRPVEAEREIGVLQIGKSSKEVYPLRFRFAELIKTKKIRNGKVATHPGYFFRDWDAEFFTNFTINENDLQQTEQVAQTFANYIKNAKICLLDSSIFHYALAKFTEIPMAGCLVISDMPHERMDEFGKYIVEVGMEMSDQELVDIVEYWLANDEKRIERAKIGQNIAMQYDALYWGDEIIKAYNHRMKGKSGLVYNGRFIDTCRAQSLTEPRNRYCPKK